MDSQRKVKKATAIDFKKIIDGYATNEEIISFLENCFELSFLSKKIKQKPMIGINSYLPNSSTRRVRGRYDRTKSSFDINPSCLHEVRYNKPGALLGLINTYGHEMTHHLENEMDIENSFVPSGEQIRSVCALTGKQLKEDLVDSIVFSCYYLCRSEVLAREGGMKFCEECLQNLNQNKYIRGKYKQKIQELLSSNEDSKKQEKETSDVCQEIKDKLRSYLLGFDLDYFSAKEKDCVDSIEKNDFLMTFNLRVKLMDPEEISREFLMLLDKENSYVKTGLKMALVSDDFPSEEKIFLREKLVEYFLGPNVTKESYNNALYGVLEKEDYRAIYKNVLINDIDKVNSTLFVNVTLTEDVFSLSRVLIDTYNKGELNINDMSVKKALVTHTDKLLEVNHSSSQSLVTKELMELKNDLMGANVCVNKNSMIK